jgi:hypothetical protein
LSWPPRIYKDPQQIDQLTSENSRYREHRMLRCIGIGCVSASDAALPVTLDCCHVSLVKYERVRCHTLDVPTSHQTQYRELSNCSDAPYVVLSDVANVRCAQYSKSSLVTLLKSLLTRHSTVFQSRPVLEHRTGRCNTLCCVKMPASMRGQRPVSVFQ